MIVTAVAAVTAVVGRLNVCEVELPAMTTLVAGKAELEPLRVTDAPPLGAGPDKVTVTLTLFPPTTDEGDTATDSTASGTRLMVVVLDEALRVAVMMTLCDERTLPAVTVKLPDADPEATFTDAGVASSALLSESCTVTALVVAALKLTVQVLDAPEARLVGLQETPVSVGLDVTVPVMLPAVPVTAMVLPVAEAATALLMPMDADVTPEASVTFTVATIPLAMGVEFMP